MRKALIIATRGSALARWQADYVAARLRAVEAGLEVELKIVKTRGDRIQDRPLASVGGKGLFVKEIELCLEQREADLAVHSIKDMPSELHPGLCIAAIPEREDPRDALVSVGNLGLAQLDQGARVGTSSLRRGCQVRGLRPDLRIVPLRGNVDTRLAKLDRGECEAILLAAAGLRRLGLGGRISELMAADRMIPAVGQGALGLECRQDDAPVLRRLAALHHEPSALCVRAERALLGKLEGGCQVPMAAHAVLDGDRLRLTALVGHPSGRPIFRVDLEGSASDPEALGGQAAARLLDQGADRVLREVYTGL